VRLVLVTAAVLALSQWRGTAVVSGLLPIVQSELQLIDPNLVVHAVILGPWRGRASLQLQANLRYPWYHGSSVILPLGWPPNPSGWYLVAVSASGVLQSVALFGIVVLAWPATGSREAAARGLLAAPLAALLFALDTPLDVLGNFQQRVLTTVDAQGLAPLFAWARFLEGGGNLALAVGLAGLAVAAAYRVGVGRNRPRRARDSKAKIFRWHTQ
jgi:hypothetical protein